MKEFRMSCSAIARIGLAGLNWLCSIAVLLSCGTLVRGDDWAQWGGPKRDLVWRETGIVKTLPTDELLPRVWSTPIDEGYSGPAVADNRVYVTDWQRQARTERVLCLDADTGQQLWDKSYPCPYTISYPNGPRSTPVVNLGRVYTIGAMGHLFCFKADTGEVLWKKNFVEDYQTNLPTWGMVASPLIDGNQLITLVGGAEDALIVSFDKATGKELWRSLNDPKVGFAPPMIYTFAGVRQLIVWHPRAISSLNPASGEVYWEIPFRVGYDLCVPMPRKIGNRLFLTSFVNGSRMIEVDGKNAKILWRGNSDSEINTDGLHSIISTPWVTETHIYGVCSYGQLRCLDAHSGKRIWETLAATGSGRWWNAFLISHKDRFFLHNEQGELIIAKLSSEGYKELSRAKLVEPTRMVRRRMTVWSHPAFAMKSVFARNDKEIVRVNLAAGK